MKEIIFIECKNKKAKFFFKLFDYKNNINSNLN